MVRLFKDRHHESIVNKKKKAVFALDTIGYRGIDENGQSLKKSDNYNAIVYYIEDESGSIAYSQVPFASRCENEIETWGWKNNYLDLEYYQGEPQGDERILTGISNYLKGKINLNFLMNAYKCMNAEQDFKRQMFQDWCVSVYDPIDLAGWTVSKVEKLRCDEGIDNNM